MAKANTLSVYKVTEELTTRVYLLIGNYSKKFKHTLGDKICEGCIELLSYITYANRSEEIAVRIKYLNDFLLKFEIVKNQLRLSYKLKCISLKQMTDISVLINDVEKQIVSWKKFSKTKENK